jgi:hypothetical protein
MFTVQDANVPEPVTLVTLTTNAPVLELYDVTVPIMLWVLSLAIKTCCAGV